MKQSYKKLSAWMILLGLFLQISTPIVAAVQSSNLKKLDASILGESGVAVKISSSELEESESVDVAHFNVQVLIEQIVADAVEQGCENKLSPALMFCYKSVLEGKTVIDVDTLIEAMPELLDYAILQEKMRAPRPSTGNANNAIVSCNGGCDLSYVIQLLSSIRERIGAVGDGACCDSILGILGDACNVPCIGENSSISEVLCEILDCCTESRTDFNGIFTVLADIENKIDLFPTFTFIVTGTFIITVTVDLSEVVDLLIEIEDTLTECCAQIHEDFEGTWTILAGLDFNCSTTVEIDLNGVFTAIADIKNTLTECCAEIKSDIFDTQTLIIDDFAQTWTILAGLDLVCSTTVVIDLNGVFTAIADVKDTLTECCAEIKSEIFDTQTLIIDDFRQIWTILEDCCACGPIPLFQSDVVGGVINLTTTGLNYCLAENITGDIIITGGNVTVDGNDRVLTGRVEINASDVIVKNTKVKSPAPVNNLEAANAGIEIQTLGINAQILNCLVECADTAIAANPAINGRIGISSIADKTLIERCHVIGGNGGQGSDNNTAAGAAGGVAINLSGVNGLIKDSIVLGGTGGNGGNSVNPVANAGNGGIGGNSIELNGNYGSVIDSRATGGNGGAGGNDSSGGGFNGGNGGSAGNGIQISADNCLIDPSTIFGGNGGNGGSVAPLGGAGNGGNGGNGGNAIDIAGTADTVLVKACFIVDGSFGGAGGLGDPGIGIDGNGGNGGNGIIVRTGAQNIQLNECNLDHVAVAGTGAVPGIAGNGIRVESGALCVQVVSNRVSCCSGTGVNNLTGTQATFYNNIVTDCNPNYANVPLIRVPGPQTGFFTNVTQGEQDCDVCETIVLEFENTWTMIEDCCACGPIPLFQSDADAGGGVITLATSGLNYCLAENITGNIVISGGNITVDGNDRVLTGRVVINAADVILKNTKVKPLAPIDNSDALNPAIEIQAFGVNVQILNCLIEVASATFTGISGRTGIISNANKTTIKDSIVVAGNGGSDVNVNVGGHGGNGIQIIGSDGLIDNLIVTAGNGGGGVGSPNPGGNGGKGIQIIGNNGSINNSTITAGSAGNGGEAADGGNGGNGIEITGDRGLIDNSTVSAGNGGNGTAGGNASDGGNGGNGIEINGNNGFVNNSIATAGSGGNGGAANFFSSAGQGGIGGNGIEINGNNGFIDNSVAVAKNGGNGATDGDGGVGGNGIEINGNTHSVSNSTTIGGNGGNGSINNFGGTSGNGGNGIQATGNTILIESLTSTAGNGGNGEVNSISANGGDGISIKNESTFIIIRSSNIINGGIGGNGLNSKGNGGNGIFLDTIIHNVQICDCKINGVGSATAPGIGGDGIQINSIGTTDCIQIINTSIVSCGGNGIHLNDNVEDCQIKNCLFECNGDAGMRVEAGVQDCQIYGCCANKNGTYGFISSNSSSNIYTNNLATYNFAGNYSTIPNVLPVLLTLTGTNKPGYWDNVYYLNP